MSGSEIRNRPVGTLYVILCACFLYLACGGKFKYRNNRSGVSHVLQWTEVTLLREIPQSGSVHRFGYKSD